MFRQLFYFQATKTNFDMQTSHIHRGHAKHIELNFIFF